MKLNHYQLSNKIRLVHKKTKGAVAHCGLIINCGSRDELVHEQGLAHFIEHVIFKGTQKRKAYHILSRMEDVGGELNAFTTKEETCVYSSFMPEFYDRSLELLSDIIFHSTFPTKELNKEKTVIIDEINSYKDNPSEQIFDDFEENIFKDHPIGNNILGTPKNVKSFDKKKVLDFIKRNYLTHEMVICSIGNIEFEKLIRYVEKYFGDIEQSKHKNIRSPFKNHTPFNLQFKHNGYQTHLKLGTIAYDANNENKTALILLNNILGGPGMNSKLNLSIREKHGLAYSVESHYTPYSDTGIFSIYLASDKQNIKQCISLVKKELAILCKKPLGPKQLKKGKLQLIGQIAIGQESEVNLMLSIGKSILLYNKVDTFEEIKNKINNVTSKQLQQVAKDVFDLSNLSYLSYKN
ncbi:MAG: M16 family metallopeptidase [Flavobacteriales bacterium]